MTRSLRLFPLVALAIAAPGASFAQAEAPPGAGATTNPAMKSQPSGRSFDESMAWLEEQVKLYGRMYGENVGGKSKSPRWFTYSVNSRGREHCKVSVGMSMWELDEGYRPTEPWWRKGTQKSTGTFSLEDVLVDGVSVSPMSDPKYRVYGPGTGVPAECIAIPLKTDAMKLTSPVRPGSTFRYSASHICVAEKGLAERAVEVVKHLARLCGAGKKGAREPLGQGR
jgi:hypothetical protein